MRSFKPERSEEGPELLTERDYPTYRCCGVYKEYDPDNDGECTHCLECGSALDWSEIGYHWNLSELYLEDPYDSEDPEDHPYDSEEGDLFHQHDNTPYNYSMDNRYTPYQVYLSIE